MERVAKSYRFKKESVDKLEEIRAAVESDLGMKISATAAIEFLINKYHADHIKK